MRSIHFDAVDLATVAAYLCPEKYASRLPLDNNLKTAIAHSQITFSINSNAQGNVGFFIFPHNCISMGLASERQFGLIRDGLSFSPETGLQIEPTKAIFGPLGPSKTQIRSYRLNSASVLVTPIVSTLENAGSLQMGYFQEQPNGTFTAFNPSLPSAQLNLLRNYQFRSLRTEEVSMIDLAHTAPMVLDDFLGSYDEGFYVLVTGAALSKRVASVTV